MFLFRVPDMPEEIVKVPMFAWHIIRENPLMIAYKGHSLSLDTQSVMEVILSLIESSKNAAWKLDLVEQVRI